MYVVVSIPENKNYIEVQNQITDFMEGRGFYALGGVVFGLGTCEFEFIDDTPVGHEDDPLVELEAELRRSIPITGLQLFVED